MALATDLTYLELRQRIASRLNRSNLDTNPLTSASVVHQFVLDRVNHYNREFFYNAQFIDTSKSTVAGEQWVNLPSGWQDVKTVRLLQGGANWIPVTRRDHQAVNHMHSVTPVITSLPSVFALHQNPTGGAMALRFFPAPDVVYPIEILMDLPPAAPTTDAEVSFWTTDAQTLLINAVCEQICRERINRPLKAAEHQKSKEEAEASLGSKSIRISGGIRTRPYL